MIFVLLFMLCFGFLVFKKSYKGGVLKTDKMWKLGGFECKKKTFFFSKCFLFNEESKLMLEKSGRTFAKKLDSVLCCVRLNAPKEKLLGESKKFFLNKLKSMPVFVVKSQKDFLVVDYTLKFEEFFAVYLSNEVKTDKEFEFGKINFVSHKNKKTVENLQALNVNFKLPSKIKTMYFVDRFSFKFKMQKTAILTDTYLLEKFQNEKIDFFVYNFFVGENITLVEIRNKTEENVFFEFVYFQDFASQKVNYFDFSFKSDYILMDNLIDNERFCFNFSNKPSKILTSTVLNVEKSNLPCLYLKYEENLSAKASKKLSFMFSKSPQPLQLLNFKKLSESSNKKLKEMFCFIIDFYNEKENKFFLNLENQARLCLLKKSEKSMFWLKGNYAFLKQKFLNDEIDEFVFFLSIKNNLCSFNEKEVCVNPQFFDFSFTLKFKQNFNDIVVNKENLNVPYLLLDGVKYYNHFSVPTQHLKIKSAKICL